MLKSHVLSILKRCTLFHYFPDISLYFKHEIGCELTHELSTDNLLENLLEAKIKRMSRYLPHRVDLVDDVHLY